MSANRFTLALTLILWSCFGECADISCGHALTYLDAARARGVIATILPVQAIHPPLGAEMQRLDELLLEVATEHLARLGPAQRESFLHAFNAFELDDSNVVAGIYSVMSSGGPELAQGSRGEPIVAADAYARYTFLGRLQMMHQFVLVEAAVTGHAPASQKNAVYREAIQYYRDQYRFLRRAFTPAQGNAVLNMVPVFDDRRKSRLVDAEVLILSKRGAGPGVFDLKLARKLGLARDLSFYLQEMANQRFLYEVRQAFEYDEVRYVKFKISQNGYKRAHHQMARVHYLRRWWNRMTFRSR